MLVRQIMTKRYEFIQPDASLREASEKMRECNCGYLPVGENDRLMGAVTDRDIVIRGIAAGHNPENVTVKEVMTEKVQYCFEEDDVKQAAERMKQEKIRRLVVLNSGKRLVGILTVGVIARGCSDNKLLGDIEYCIAKAA